MNSLYLRRRITNWIAMGLSMLATLVGLAFLAWILWETLRQGIAALNFSLFTKITANGAEGGLANAMVGSLVINFIGIAVATPIGVLAGAWLAEYANRTKLGESIRFLNDILLSAPSIVIGLFVYTVVVAQTGKFSGWAGVVALALLEIPIVIRTTENMLKLVPNALREAAFALGTPKWKVVAAITLKASIGGIMTGVLLAIARIAGETAPLLFTALSNQFFSLNMSEPIANLPVTIYKFALSPYPHWQQLAWAGVFLITVGVLGLNILARAIFSKK